MGGDGGAGGYGRLCLWIAVLALLAPHPYPALGLWSDLLRAGAEEISRPPDQCLCHCSQARPQAYPGSLEECT